MRIITKPAKAFHATTELSKLRNPGAVAGHGTKVQISWSNHVFSILYVVPHAVPRCDRCMGRRCNLYYKVLRTKKREVFVCEE